MRVSDGILSQTNRSRLCTSGDRVQPGLEPFGVCFRVFERMCRCDVWLMLLLLLAQSGTASVLTDRILSELNMQVLSDQWTCPISAHKISIYYYYFKLHLKSGPFLKLFRPVWGSLRSRKKESLMWRPVPFVLACDQVVSY
jgi:hypothetical protein